MSSPIRVLIADDHNLFRNGLKSIIAQYVPEDDIIVAGEAVNGADALEKIATCSPDVVLMDIQMPGIDGIKATSLIKDRYKNVQVIALTTFSESYPVYSMVEAGAKGFLLKTSSFDEVVTAIHTVHDGATYFVPEATMHLVRRIEDQKHYKRNEELLGERDIQIIRLVCEGYSNKEIARKIGLTKRTIDSYRNRVMEKINVKNAMELMSYAVSNGIFRLPVFSAKI